MVLRNLIRVAKLPRMRTRALPCFAVMLSVALAGCESDTDRKVLAAREIAAKKNRGAIVSAQKAKSAIAAKSSGSDENGKPKIPGAFDIDIPLYPGATPYPEGSRVMHTEDGLATGVLETPDNSETIIKYYKEKLTGSDMSVKEHLRDGKKETTLRTLQSDGDLHVVEVKEGGKGSLIELMSIQSAKKSSAPESLGGGKASSKLDASSPQPLDQAPITGQSIGDPAAGGGKMNSGSTRKSF